LLFEQQLSIEAFLPWRMPPGNHGEMSGTNASQSSESNLPTISSQNPAMFESGLLTDPLHHSKKKAVFRLLH
jgi:hypothetical protein